MRPPKKVSGAGRAIRLVLAGAGALLFLLVMAVGAAFAAGPLSDATDVVIGNDEPLIDGGNTAAQVLVTAVAPGGEPAPEPVGRAAAPVSNSVEKAVEPTDARARKVSKTVETSVKAVSKRAGALTTPSKTVEPVSKRAGVLTTPIAQAFAPVVDPVTDMADRVAQELEPVTDTLAPITALTQDALASVVGLVEPVVGPIQLPGLLVDVRSPVVRPVAGVPPVPPAVPPALDTPTTVMDRAAAISAGIMGAGVHTGVPPGKAGAMAGAGRPPADAQHDSGPSMTPGSGLPVPSFPGVPSALLHAGTAGLILLAWAAFLHSIVPPLAAGALLRAAPAGRRPQLFVEPLEPHG